MDEGTKAIVANAAADERDRFAIIADAVHAYAEELHAWRMRGLGSGRQVELFRTKAPVASVTCDSEAQADGFRCAKAMEAALTSAGVVLPAMPQRPKVIAP